MERVQALVLAIRNLRGERKVDPKRITAQGFGADRPLDDNATLQGRARNRRIEFTLLDGSP